MIINHNMASLNTYGKLSSNNTATAKSLEKLSSGLRINRAGDDAAGLAISEKMRGQIRGLDQATRNSQDGISMIQTAEGALNETHSILQRMRELAVQSANDTSTTADRGEIQKEVDQLAKEITRISNTTEFNTKNLLAGGLSATFHIGANAGQNISLTVSAMDAKTLGVATDTNIAGAFAAGATTLTTAAIGSTDLGKGLVGGSTYSVQVTHTGAAVAAGAQTMAGTYTLTGSGYTGARDAANVIFKGTANVAGNASSGYSAMQYSTDGGVTWNAANVAAAAGVTTVTYQGATFTIGTSGGNATGLTINVSFSAAKDSLQLSGGGANIGAAVTAYSDMSSVTIGNAASSQTITVHAANFGALTTGTATQGVVAQASTVATLAADGSVTADAVTQAGVDVSTQAAASTAITTINTAITTVSSERSKLGAYQNRLEHTISNLSTSSENLTAAESRIRDVDMAKEMMTFQKNNILAQAATAMLAQANQQPQGVLQLLR